MFAVSSRVRYLDSLFSFLKKTYFTATKQMFAIHNKNMNKYLVLIQLRRNYCLRPALQQ